MKEEKYILELTDWERRVLVSSLVEARNSYLDKDAPIEDVCDVLQKTIDAPTKKMKKKERSAAR